MRRLRPVVLAALALGALSAPPAGASVYSQVLRAYEARGSISPCQFSSQQLNQALKGIDTYGAQYFADFTAAIQNALSARAAGACEPHPAATAPAQAGPLAPLELPGLTASSDSGPPLVLVILAAMLGALALAGVVAAVARSRGWSPRWWDAWSHAWREARYRVGATWAELADWLRSA